MLHLWQHKWRRKCLQEAKYRRVYEASTSMPIRGQDGPCHISCYRSSWLSGAWKGMHFGISRIWSMPTCHTSNCYWCMTDICKQWKRVGGKNVIYPDITPPTAAVLNREDLPATVPSACKNKWKRMTKNMTGTILAKNFRKHCITVAFSKQSDWRS